MLLQRGLFLACEEIKKKKVWSIKVIQIVIDYVAKDDIYCFAEIDSSDLCLFF